MIDESFPEALTQLGKRFKSLFGISVQNWTQGGRGLSVGLPTYNQGFKNSKYYLNPVGQTFSHLTSYNKLFSIINSGKLRLYNLKNSNDPNELFLVKELSQYPEIVENLKENTFIFSFCQNEEISDPKLWETYGTVTLNFQFINDPDPWHEFRLSKMHYDENPIGMQYKQMIEQLQKEYPGWEFINDYGSLISLLAFHKRKEHKYEKEIRLMYLPHLFMGDLEQHFDFRVGDYHTGFTEYIELPFYSEPSLDTWVVRKNITRHSHKIDLNTKEHPQIKILSIQFGDNEEKVTQEKLNDLRYELEDYLVGKFGYKILVEPKLFKTGISSKINS